MPTCSSFISFFLILLLVFCHGCHGDWVMMANSGGSSPVQSFSTARQVNNHLQQQMIASKGSFRNAMLGWRNQVCQLRLLKCSQLLSRNIWAGTRGAFFLWAVQTANEIMNENPFQCLL